MNKLPLWAWDEEQGKYVVFPYEKLETFKDGKKGFSWPGVRHRGDYEEAAKIVQRFRRHFKYQLIKDRYVVLDNFSYKRVKKSKNYYKI